MKSFRAALSTLPNSKPIFRLTKSRYHPNFLEVEVANHVVHENSEDDNIDLQLAKEFFKESYSRTDEEFITSFSSCITDLKYEIASYLLKFVTQHSPQKHVKNTKLYKFTEKLRFIIVNDDIAAEAYYSVFKYLKSNDAVNLDSTNIHVQNGFKILETLRNKFEKN